MSTRKRPTGKMVRLDRAAPESTPSPAEPVRLVIEYEGKDDFLDDYAQTLSGGAAMVEAPRTLLLDTPVELVVSFPGLREPFALAGVVGAVLGQPDPSVGIELSAQSREQLAAIADRIAHGDPRLVIPVIRLLLVEDNPHICELIGSGLRAAGRRNFGREVAFDVAAAHDGAQALALLDGRPYDALIVDAYVPVLDGAKLIEHARARHGAALPIIGLSGGGEPARNAVLRAGANAFLDKPVRLQQLLAQLRTLLPGVEPAPVA